MTLHAAKGLEFPVVFIVAVEDGVLPHERVGQHPDELEEERRLAFVGITRAKEELQLRYAVTRDFRGVRRRHDSQLVPDGNAARRNGDGRRGRRVRRTVARSLGRTGRRQRRRFVGRLADRRCGGRIDGRR